MARKIVSLEAQVADLQRIQDVFTSNVLPSIMKAFQETSAKLQTMQWLSNELLQSHPQRLQIAASLRVYVQSEFDNVVGHPLAHYESAMLLVLNAMLEAAGEPPRQ